MIIGFGTSLRLLHSLLKERCFPFRTDAQLPNRQVICRLHVMYLVTVYPGCTPKRVDLALVFFGWLCCCLGACRPGCVAFVT